MHTAKFSPAGATLALALLQPSHAAASVTWKQLTIGGFFSQGYLYSENNNFPTANRDGTWDFREMAVNVSTNIGAHARVGAQAFAQKFGALGGDKVILDWAVADYNVSSAFGVRVGRIKYPKGLYGEALDLDVVRPFVFLPNAVYSPVLRDFSASFDGGMVYGSLPAGQGSVDYKLFYGDIPITPQKGVAEFYNNAGFFAAPGVRHLAIDSVVGGQLVWNPSVPGLKLAYSFSQYQNLAADGPFLAYPVISLTSNFRHFSWHTASVEYVWKDWTFAGEFQRCDGKLVYSAPPLLPAQHGDTGWDGWYVSASRRLNSRFELGAYHGRLTNRFGTGGSGDPRNHQYDTAVSLRFDLNEHVLFKLEAHALDGRYQTFNTVRIPNPAPANHDTVIAVKTTLSF